MVFSAKCTLTLKVVFPILFVKADWDFSKTFLSFSIKSSNFLLIIEHRFGIINLRVLGHGEGYYFSFCAFSISPFIFLSNLFYAKQLLFQHKEKSGSINGTVLKIYFYFFIKEGCANEGNGISLLRIL